MGRSRVIDVKDPAYKGLTKEEILASYRRITRYGMSKFEKQRIYNAVPELCGQSPRFLILFTLTQGESARAGIGVDGYRIWKEVLQLNAGKLFDHRCAFFHMNALRKLKWIESELVKQEKGRPKIYWFSTQRGRGKFYQHIVAGHKALGYPGWPWYSNVVGHDDYIAIGGRQDDPFFKYSLWFERHFDGESTRGIPKAPKGYYEENTHLWLNQPILN